MITKIDSGTFKGLGSLKKLELKGNKLGVLTPQMFTGLSGCVTLRLDNAEITGKQKLPKSN